MTRGKGKKKKTKREEDLKGAEGAGCRGEKKILRETMGFSLGLGRGELREKGGERKKNSQRSKSLPNQGGMSIGASQIRPSPRFRGG